MKLAVFFPGIGYHCDKPLLYFSRKLAMEEGYETLNVDYSYEGGSIRDNKEKLPEVFKILNSQAEEFLDKVDFEKYEEVLFISKSVGTVIATAYAAKNEIKCRQVLYTPLEQTFSTKPGESIAFIGRADPWSDVDKVIDMAMSLNVSISVYEDVNHSLEGKDTLKNIEILKDVMDKTREFILE